MSTGPVDQSSNSDSVTMLVVVSLGLYLVITSTYEPIDSLSLYDAKRVLQVALFTVLLLLAVIYKPLREASIAQLASTRKAIAYAFLLFFAIGIASSLRLTHPSYAVLDVSMLFVILVMVFVSAGSRDLNQRAYDRWAIALIAFMGMAVGVQELMGYLMGWVTGSEFNYQLVLMHFANPRHYNHLQTWSIPLLVLLPLIFPERKWLGPVSIGLLGLQWFLVFSTGARGSFVSLLTAMILMALLLPKLRRHWMKPQVLGFLVGAVIYASVLHINNMTSPKGGDFYQQSVGRTMMHTSGRSLMWQYSIQDAINHPLLGSGPTRYACDATFTGMFIPGSPHSFPFRIMGEWGFIALGLILLIVLMISIKLMVALRSGHTKYGQQQPASVEPDLVKLSLLSMSILAAGIHASVSSVLDKPASQVEMIIIFAWALSLYNIRRTRNRSRVARAVLVLALAMSVLQIVFVSSEIPKLGQRTAVQENHEMFFPRFWWKGKTCDYRYDLDTG